jgi:hypothetical protein
MDELVLDALGQEWAKRYGVSLIQIRSAILNGNADGDRILQDLRSQIGDVNLQFQRKAEDRSVVILNARTRLTDSAAAVTVTAPLPWERLPGDVRAEFLRGGQSDIEREWRPRWSRQQEN